MSLFSTYTLGAIPEGNCIVNAPMTRSRAINPEVAPTRLFAADAQCAAAGNRECCGRSEELPLAPWNATSFYTGGPEGYADYPTMPAPQAVAQ